MRNHVTALVTALLFALGCASSSSGPARPEPELQLTQLSDIADAARHISGGINVQYRLTIHNTTAIPLQLKRIEMQSIGSGAYTLPSLSRAFDQTIDAGASHVIELWGPAVIEDPTVAGANGPVTIRVIAQFDSTNGSFQTVAVQQVHAGG